MKQSKKHIDDLFREKLGDYAEVPPADAWGELDSRLDMLTPVAPHAPYHWLGHVGMVSVIAVLGVSVLSRFVNDRAGIPAETGTEQVATSEGSATAMPTSVQVVGASEPEVPPTIGESESAGATGIASENGPIGGSTGTTLSNGGGRVASSAPQNKGRQSVSRMLPGKSRRTANVEENMETTPDQLQHFNSSNNVDKQNQQSDNQIDELKENKVAPNSKAPVVSVKPLGKNTVDVVASAKEKANVDFPRWGAGVKVGYERGADNIAAKKVVVAPYLQYSLSRRVAIMTQPAVKVANSPVRTISSRSYYAPNDDGKVVSVQNYVEPRAEGGVVDTYYFSRFRYTRSHDSIVKNETIGGRYLEFELPVMMRYSVTKNVSVYGGLNMVFSQLSGVKQNTYTKTLTRTADSLMSAKSVSPSPVAINDVITYEGNPITGYDGPLYPSSQVNRLRLGATVGVTYEYSNRWLLDALVQQNPAPKDMRGAYNINAPLSSTYFRLSVGYKLTK